MSERQKEIRRRRHRTKKAKNARKREAIANSKKGAKKS